MYEKFKENERELGTLWKQIVAYEFYTTEKNRGTKQIEVDRLRSEGEDLVKMIDT
jgi:hypothetical protein